MHYDVFNGDADGIIALLQLRKAQPLASQLITGVKRDIKLLEQVCQHNDASSVTVLDVSMESNKPALCELLARDIEVFYCDHHRSGDLPEAAHLTTLIDLDANTCTSLLINQHLGGQFAQWALVGAYGDNMLSSAEQLADQIGLSVDQRSFLQSLGTLINYNGYGATVADLHVAPASLFNQLMQYDSPFDLLEDPHSPYHLLKAAYGADIQQLDALTALVKSPIATVFELPCQPWARRISGDFGNQLANQSPKTAHAVLTLNASEQDYTVSVRAPLEKRTGADEICAQFPTGGGRKAAAGINQLPIDQKDLFIEVLTGFYTELT